MRAQLGFESKKTSFSKQREELACSKREILKARITLKTVVFGWG